MTNDDYSPETEKADAAMKRKLNRLSRLANEVVAEARERFGDHATLFYEAGGSFNVMDRDGDWGAVERQAHIKVDSSVPCQMGAGAW